MEVVPIKGKTPAAGISFLVVEGQPEQQRGKPRERWRNGRSLQQRHGAKTRQSEARANRDAKTAQSGTGGRGDLNFYQMKPRRPQLNGVKISAKFKGGICWNLPKSADYPAISDTATRARTRKDISL